MLTFLKELFLLHLIFKALFVKLGVKGIEVLFLELVGKNTKVLAEALVMHNLTLSEEADSVLDVRIVSASMDMNYIIQNLVHVA